MATQDLARCGVHKVYLLTCDAGDRLIGVHLIGRDLLGGPALHALVSIRAVKKERRHANTPDTFKFVRFELCQKRLVVGSVIVPRRRICKFAVGDGFVAQAKLQAGDRIAAENYYQHAEHYFRMSSDRGAT
jgi:hypothetical protein